MPIRFYIFSFYFYEVLGCFRFYHVLSLGVAIRHVAHLSLMTHDPFLLGIFKKVMDLNCKGDIPFS